MPTPEQDAEALLRREWLDPLGDIRIPVDPVRIARNLGIGVYTADLPDNESGRVVNRPNRDPEIYLNRSDSKNRQRFTCAHELGHYWRRTNAGQFDYHYIDRRDELAGAGTNPDEIYANQFAAALLMPQYEVRRSRGAELSLVARTFRVSPEAMAFRRKNLGIPVAS